MVVYHSKIEEDLCRLFWLEVTTLVQEDPTWAAEYAHFKALCLSDAETDLSNDLWLNGLMKRLGDDAVRGAAR